MLAICRLTGSRALARDLQAAPSVIKPPIASGIDLLDGGVNAASLGRR